MSGLLIKICGLSTPDTLEAALEAGADMAGFVFFAPSPRNVSFETAARLGAQVRGRAQKVALSVDADDALLDGVVQHLQPDLLQFHGRETPERLRELKARYGLPAMKALHISERADLAAMAIYAESADRLLFDARPPRGAILPGGNGAAFDWTILQDIHPPRPWMLSGGLNPDNVAEALRVTHAPALDVSSGVESAPGVKDVALIRSFVQRARRGVSSQLS